MHKSKKIKKYSTKVKSGEDLLFSQEFSKDYNIMVINFQNRYRYSGFYQKDTRLFIQTFDGDIVIVFCGDVPVLKFNHFEKDQLVLDILED